MINATLDDYKNDTKFLTYSAYMLKTYNSMIITKITHIIDNHTDKIQNMS